MKTRALVVWSAGIAATAAVLGTRQSYRRWKRAQVERLGTESHLLETARGTVEYQMAGEGPVVLMIHGGPGGYDQGMALARFLNLQGVTVLTLSRPGYRRTPLTSGQTPEAQADLFAAALEALQVPQAVVIAVSWGGPSALQFALRYPDRCRGLIMLSAQAEHYTEEEVSRSLPLGERLLRRLFWKLFVFDPFLYLLDGLSNWLPQGAPLRAFVASGLIGSLVMNPDRTAGYRNDAQQFADLPAYPTQEIAVPTLIVHGTSDVEVPFRQAELLAKNVPQAQLVTVQDADHFSAWGDERAVAAIHTFLQKIEGRETLAYGADLKGYRKRETLFPGQET